MAKLRHLLLVVGVAVLVTTTLGVGKANAGLLGCSFPTLSQPFAAWGDWTKYYLSPGGGFESSGWKLSNGASVGAGNESYFVNDSSDAHSLVLPAGASGQSPYSCITALDLKLRMFVRSDSSSPVRIDVVVPGLLGLVKVVSTYTVSTSPDWQPTSVVVNLLNVLAATNLTSANIAVRVTSVGGATAQVDDVFIDPSWTD